MPSRGTTHRSRYGIDLYHKNVSKPFQAVVGQIREYREHPEPDARVVAELAKIGKEAIYHAAENKDTGNITYNQQEAYGYGVYFNHECIKKGFYDTKQNRGEHFSNPRVRNGKKVYGRKEVTNAIKTYYPPNKGYCLCIFNAIWYSTIHERWGLNIVTRELKEAYTQVEQLLSGYRLTPSITTFDTRI